jgi:putative salt-induced outer membrane protein YdiY
MIPKTPHGLLLTSGLILFVFLQPQPTSAQQAAPPPPPPEREGNADFAFVGTTGNSSTTSIGLGGEFIDRPAPWEFSIKANYVRNESASTLQAESVTVATKAARKIDPRTSVFVTYVYLRDQFAGIEDRNDVAGGIAYALIAEPRSTLTVDAGVGYAHETRVVGPHISTATVPTGAVYKLKISETTDLNEEGRFVFSLSDGTDWRFSNVFSVTAKMTSLFSLKFSNTVRFVNDPPPSFQKTDTITAAALVAKF